MLAQAKLAYFAPLAQWSYMVQVAQLTRWVISSISTPHISLSFPADSHIYPESSSPSCNPDSHQTAEGWHWIPPYLSLSPQVCGQREDPCHWIVRPLAPLVFFPESAILL